MSNSVMTLLNKDAGLIDAQRKGVFKSKRLQRIYGEEMTFEIVEVSPRRMQNIREYGSRKNGELDVSKAYDTDLMLCAAGCPELSNEDLQKHFSCNSAKELAEKMLQLEATEMARAIAELSTDTTDEGEIKN